MHPASSSVNIVFINTNYIFPCIRIYIHAYTGVDLSKILGGQTKILGGQKVIKSDKCMVDSQLLEGTCPGCHQTSQSLRLCMHTHIHTYLRTMHSIHTCCNMQLYVHTGKSPR